MQNYFIFFKHPFCIYCDAAFRHFVESIWRRESAVFIPAKEYIVVSVRDPVRRVIIVIAADISLKLNSVIILQSIQCITVIVLYSSIVAFYIQSVFKQYRILKRIVIIVNLPARSSRHAVILVADISVSVHGWSMLSAII